MQNIRQSKIEITGAQIFVFAFAGFCVLAAVLIGSFPLQLSIGTIFLFAGVHNFMEFRYFVARMPLRWGRSRTFYLTGIFGVVVLAASYLTLYFASGNWLWGAQNWTVLVSIWNTALVMWVASLFVLRGQQKRRDWTIAFAIGFVLCALAWIAPAYWSIALVYLHPFVAMWFLERQIRRTKPEWLRAYHICLAMVPVFLVILWAALSAQPSLSEETNLFWRITQHAGADVFPSVSSHVLVATHVFLETIHYMVWIVMIPLVDLRAVPWKLDKIPLAGNAKGYPKIIATVMAVSVLMVLALWAGFAVDYTTARDVYFALAIAHVLAEFPFLVKML